MKNYVILLLSLLILTSCESDDPIQYKLSTQVNPSEGGTISPSSGTYDEGEEITFKAIPSDEYVFKSWSDDASGDENPMTVVMTDDMFLTANFEKRTYTLTVEIQGEGTVTEEIVPGKSTTDYPSGTTVQLTSTPEDDWVFFKWSGDHEGNENPLNLFIDKPMSLTAVFQPIDQNKIFVPDDNFEQALIDLGLDDVLDDYVNQVSIENILELRLENMQINDLTGIEGFTSLNELILSNNNLSSVDLSQNSSLHTLVCDNNQLSSLDISNHFYSSVVVTGNQLSCIKVHKGQLLADSDWLTADDEVTYSVDCSVTMDDLTFVPDDALEQALIDLNLDDVLDDYVKTIAIINRTNLDLSGKNISDITGMEDFKSLLNIDLSNNKLSSFDILVLWPFRYLDLRNNPLDCIQVNEFWLETGGGGLYFIWADEGVEYSLDCGY